MHREREGSVADLNAKVKVKLVLREQQVNFRVSDQKLESY